MLIAGAASGGGHTLFSNRRGDLATTAAADVAPRLYATAGIGPDEIDVLELYDAFTPLVLLQLEDYGFCKKGEAGPLVASGATGFGGRLPVNTHGGHLSEGYVHGLNHAAEAVSQLRGDAGERQVAGRRGRAVDRPARLRRRQHRRRHLEGPVSGNVVPGADRDSTPWWAALGASRADPAALRRVRRGAMAAPGDLQPLRLARVALGRRRRAGAPSRAGS